MLFILKRTHKYNKKEHWVLLTAPTVSEEMLWVIADIQSISHPGAWLILETSHRPCGYCELPFQVSLSVEAWLSQQNIWHSKTLRILGKCKSVTESWQREGAHLRRLCTSQDKVPAAPDFVASGMNRGAPGTTEHPLFSHWPWSGWLGSTGILIKSCLDPTPPTSF